MTDQASSLTGVESLIGGVSRHARDSYRGRLTPAMFINAIADDYAFIRMRDILSPIRFLRQMEGAPPVQLGTTGFRRDLVDDLNPARHYMAFVFVGYWLPYPLALVLLWIWEVAGFVRYGGVWSAKDVANGLVGIRHGRWVRTVDPVVLPALIAAELAEPPLGHEGASTTSSV